MMLLGFVPHLNLRASILSRIQGLFFIEVSLTSRNVPGILLPSSSRR